MAVRHTSALFFQGIWCLRPLWALAFTWTYLNADTYIYTHLKEMYFNSFTFTCLFVCVHVCVWVRATQRTWLSPTMWVPQGPWPPTGSPTCKQAGLQLIKVSLSLPPSLALKEHATTAALASFYSGHVWLNTKKLTHAYTTATLHESFHV